MWRYYWASVVGNGKLEKSNSLSWLINFWWMKSETGQECKKKNSCYDGYNQRLVILVIIFDEFLINQKFLFRIQKWTYPKIM